MKYWIAICILAMSANTGMLSAQESEKNTDKKIIVIRKQDKDGKVTEERFESENGRFSEEDRKRLKEMRAEIKENEDGENMTISIATERTLTADDGPLVKKMKKGKPGKKAWLGAPELREKMMHRGKTPQSPGQENKAVLGIGIDDTRYGVKVTEIMEGSAAEKAGLRRGDVILKVNDSYIFSADGLLEALHPFNPGDKIKLKYLREGKEKSASVTLKANQN